MKPVIALDIDDVLYPTAQYLADAVGSTIGLKIDAYAEKTGRLSEIVSQNTGMNIEESAALIRDAFLHESFGDMHPFAEAVSAVNKLSEQYEIIAVTARSLESHSSTRNAIERDFGTIITEVYFPNQVSWTEPFLMIDKMPHLIEAGANWLIDDKPAHLLPLEGTGIRGGLFGRYPWNSSAEIPDFIVRFENWNEVVVKLSLA